MSTNIVCKMEPHDKVTFGKLQNKTAFIYQQVPYFKVQVGSDFNAIDLRDMSFKIFANDYEVIPRSNMEISLK